MKLKGAWRRDYSEFFDTEEALLIDAMDNADSVYTVFYRLQALAVKCGCTGRLLFRNEVPYTDEMLAAVTKKTVPAFRQSVQPLIQLGLVTVVDGVYTIADWELNQNATAIDEMHEGNRVRKASERARKNGGKTASEKKREKLAAYLAAHPSATKTEMHKATGLSRVTIDKYLTELPVMLPAPEESGVQKAQGDVQSVQEVQMYTVQNGVQMDVQLYTEMYNNLYTPHADETAGSTAEKAEKGNVQNVSRPKNIDDRYKKSSTSTSLIDIDDVTGGERPTREDVRGHFTAMGYRLSPDRFFDVNEGRGWVTNAGKPVDDWKKLARVWESHEQGTPTAPATPTGHAQAQPPSVEDVMAKWSCTRERAILMMREDMC